MAAMAVAAELGGAVGIRANGPDDISAIKERVHLPVIGVYKKQYVDSDVYITPTFREAKAIAGVGAEIIALDGTDRIRPEGISLPELVRRIKMELNVWVMADISTVEEGIKAAEYGFEIVATTLSGYTPYSTERERPNLRLVEELAAKVSIPIVAEGNITCPKQAREALERGAHCVVVGRAITDPWVITERFVQEMGEAGGV